MGKRFGDIEFHAGPKEAGAPDNLERKIVKFLDGANERLEIAVQEIENERIGRAIIHARRRGVLVKVVLEQDYLIEPSIQWNPWKEGGRNEENRRILNALLRAHVDVKCDYNPAFFHNKFIVRDDNSVLTGSANFTPTGTHANLNHLVIVHDPKVARMYSREFAEIQEGHFGAHGAGNDDAPTDVLVSDILVRVRFSPDHDPEAEIVAHLEKAKKRVDFAIYTFSSASGIDDAMLALLGKGRTVRGAFDAGQGEHSWAAIPTLGAAGADLFAVDEGDGVRKLHHQLMIVDDQVVIAGSFNYTKAANRENDENIIILGDLDAQSVVQRDSQARVAKYVKKEIDRIIAEHGAAI